MFWNVNRRPVLPLLAELVVERAVDVVVLAESEFSTVALLEALNTGATTPYHFPFGFPVKVVVLARLPKGSVAPLLDDEEISIRRISPPIGADFLLVAMHLPSKLYLDYVEQAMLSRRFVEPIERAEESVGHSRTVVMGDLNMNPFEPGVVGSEGFHAVSTRRVAARIERQVLKRDRKFFYNPSWKWFLETASSPAGTYFHRNPGPLALYWNVFDQVLFRPALLDNVVDNDVQLVSRIGDTDLLKPDGSPDGAVGSDHLPIVVRLEL